MIFDLARRAEAATLAGWTFPVRISGALAAPLRAFPNVTEVRVPSGMRLAQGSGTPFAR